MTPPDSERATAFEAHARRVLGLYGYREIRLPTMELRELFVKSTGETTDIVEGEMFELHDAGGRRLALRPEGTPGAVRAYLAANGDPLGAGGAPGRRAKLFYVGSMFRAERPQAGRYREFVQVGAECFGSSHPASDVELILALAAILDSAGLCGRYDVHVNNLGCDREPSCRPAYRKSLIELLQGRRESLCEHCQRRLEINPLRALDCKRDGPSLARVAPALGPCPACREHGRRVAAMLEGSSLAGRFRYPAAGLVRGLDYYDRTVFEFKSSGLGAQDAIAGGGRYDSLVKSMGGPDTPAVGWAVGVERALLAAGEKAPSAGVSPRVFVAVQAGGGPSAPNGPDPAAMDAAALSLLERLRAAGIPAEGGFGTTLKAQMREADRLGAELAVIIGDREFPRGECLLRDMRGGGQSAIPLERALDSVTAAFGPAGGSGPSPASPGA